MWPFRKAAPLTVVKFVPLPLSARVSDASERLARRDIVVTRLEINRREFADLFAGSRLAHWATVPGYWGMEFDLVEMVDGPTRVGGMRKHGRYEVVPWVWEVASAGAPEPPACQVVQVGVKFPGVPVANRVRR